MGGAAAAWRSSSLAFARMRSVMALHHSARSRTWTACRGERLELDEILAFRRGGALGVPEGGEPGGRAVHEEREAGRGGRVLVVGLGDGAPAVAGDDGGGPGEPFDGVQVAAGVGRARFAEQVAGDDLVGEERVEQRRDAIRIGVVEERLEARAADQDVAAVGVREQEHGAAVADGAAVLADGLVEQPEPAREIDAGNGVRDGGGQAEGVDVVARGQRPAGGARRAGEDRHPLQQVAVAQDLGARLDPPFESAVDAGSAGAFEECPGVADERRDVVDGDQIAGAGDRRVVGWHGVVSLQSVDRSRPVGAAAAERSRAGARAPPRRGSGLDRERRRARVVRCRSACRRARRRRAGATRRGSPRRMSSGARAWPLSRRARAWRITARNPARAWRRRTRRSRPRARRVSWACSSSARRAADRAAGSWIGAAGSGAHGDRPARTAPGAFHGVSPL